MTPRRILLVDDDPVYLMLGSEELASQGYNVRDACNGAEALDMLRNEPFDIVISDLEMPTLDGIGLLDGIRADPRESVSELPFIMITGRGDIDSVARAFDRGATSFVQKPVNWITLIHHVGFVLRAGEQAAALRVARDEAKRALHSKTAVLMALRHEMRSPLHVIQGFTDLLSNKLSATADAETTQAFGFIHDGVDDMIDKIDKLFLYADIVNGDREFNKAETSPAMIVKLATERVKKLVETSGTTVIVDHGDPDADVRFLGDEKMLSTAIGHILDNAIKFGTDSSEVRVRTGRTGDRIEIRIEDGGEGFDLASTDTYLEGFGQRDDGLTRTSSGVGLGLTLASNLAWAHGGTLDLSNSESGGGVVTMRLRPLCDEESEDGADAMAEPQRIAV